jgi:diguanylate cyclase (GGDEF)-like protein
LAKTLAEQKGLSAEQPKESDNKKAKKLKKEIEELKKENRRIEKDSITDPLSRALTRGKFNTDIKSYYEKHNDLSFAFIDGDHFKNINDTFGHQGGDEMIKSISDELHSGVRELGKNAKVYRYGGEEFVIIFINTRREEVLSILEKIRSSMENKITYSGEDKMKLTLSIGVSFKEDFPNESALAVLDYSDKAVYKAKETGRNKIVVYKNSDNQNSKKKNIKKSQEIDKKEISEFSKKILEGSLSKKEEPTKEIKSEKKEPSLPSGFKLNFDIDALLKDKNKEAQKHILVDNNDKNKKNSNDESLEIVDNEILDELKELKTKDELLLEKVISGFFKKIGSYSEIKELFIKAEVPSALNKGKINSLNLKKLIIAMDAKFEKELTFLKWSKENMEIAIALINNFGGQKKLISFKCIKGQPLVDINNNFSFTTKF